MSIMEWSLTPQFLHFLKKTALSISHATERWGEVGMEEKTKTKNKEITKKRKTTDEGEEKPEAAEEQTQ